MRDRIRRSAEDVYLEAVRGDDFIGVQTYSRTRIGAAGRQRVVERWSWKHCAQLTVEQYREVLAMPHNVAKLRTNGRL